MKYSLYLLIIPAYILVACFSNEPKKPLKTIPVAKANYTNMEKGFAVIELFTSQGCSSCPPADKVLTEWVEKAANEHLNVYPIAFHVDYWNKLGWKDPFSQEKFTKRQSAYADIMNLNSIYTPQAVINGTSECVGSSKDRMENYIKKALSEMPEAKIRIAMPSTTDGVIDKIAYAIEGNYDNCLLNVAIVERDLVTKVPRGENGGRTLTNDNVVREFNQISPEKSGSIKLNYEKNAQGKISVVLYLQDKSSLKIKAANAVRI